MQLYRKNISRRKISIASRFRENNTWKKKIIMKFSNQRFRDFDFDWGSRARTLTRNERKFSTERIRFKVNIPQRISIRRRKCTYLSKHFCRPNTEQILRRDHHFPTRFSCSLAVTWLVYFVQLNEPAQRFGKLREIETNKVFIRL